MRSVGHARPILKRSQNNGLEPTSASANGLQRSQLNPVSDGHPGQGVKLDIMRPTIEAEVDEKGNIQPKEKVNLTPGSQLLITVVEVPAPGEAAILGEPALATDWSRPEEDAAWADLGQA